MKDLRDKLGPGPWVGRSNPPRPGEFTVVFDEPMPAVPAVTFIATTGTVSGTLAPMPPGKKFSAQPTRFESDAVTFTIEVVNVGENA